MPKKREQQRKAAEHLKALTEDHDRLSTRCRTLQADKTTLQTEKSKLKHMLSQTIAQRVKPLLLVQAFCNNEVYRGAQASDIVEQTNKVRPITTEDPEEDVDHHDSHSDVDQWANMGWGATPSLEFWVHLLGMLMMTAFFALAYCADLLYKTYTLQDGVQLMQAWLTGMFPRGLHGCNCGGPST